MVNTENTKISKYVNNKIKPTILLYKNIVKTYNENPPLAKNRKSSKYKKNDFIAYTKITSAKNMKNNKIP